MPIFVDQNPLAVRSRKLLKKAIAVAQAGIGVRRVGDLVEQLPPLAIGAADEPLAEAIGRQPIDQREAAAHRDLPPRLVDHHEVHELPARRRRWRCRSARRFGMIRSTSTPTVAYSCAVKNFGLNGVAGFAACARAASACSCACRASAGVQTSAAAAGAAANNSSAARRDDGLHAQRSLRCAAAR